MIHRKWFGGLFTAIAVALVTPGMARAQDVPVARNVVLVHGLYADGSSWIDVLGYLQRAGLNVTAVQNPLIISEAGNDPKVSALVYVAARAPDAGEDFAALAAKYPKPPASAGVVRKDGFFWLSEAAFLRDFAGDVEPSKARALFAVQGRGADGLPNTKTTTAAWNREPDSAGCGPEEIAMTATRVQGELPAEFPARHP